MRRILGQLGEDATFTPKGGAATIVRGIYSAPFATSPLGVGIAGSAPRFECMSADIPGVSEGDTINVRGITYTIVGPEPDPVSGITVLQLEEH